MKCRLEVSHTTDGTITFRSLAEMPPMPVSLGPTLSNKTGSWRYMRPFYQDRTPPCNHACPAGSDIVHYIGALRDGDVEKAWRILVAENPLPGVCGRVCPHPCELECSRGDLGGAITIRALERYLADEARAHGWCPERATTAQAHRVGIVGSGPAGLSCAYHLARLGYKPMVFEGEGKAGGLLQYGIPSYRLPRAVLDHEVAGIEALGVRFVLNKRLGDNLSWPELLEMDAVFLALGQGLSRPMAVPGEGSAGVFGGLEFLRRVAQGKPVDLGHQVVVIGGGNTAMDAARTAIRQGAVVTVVYRRTERQMPAIPEEISEARDEGVEFMFLASPTEVMSQAGRVHGLRCIRMRLGEPDASGRERPLPIQGTQLDIPAEAIIVATGQEVDASPIVGTEIELRDRQIVINEAARTTLNGVFAGGDAATGAGTVAHAIGSGKRAALAIDRQLRGKSLEGFPRLDRAVHIGERPAASLVVRVEDLNTDHIETTPRPPLAQRAAAVRKDDFTEVNLGLAAEDVRREAERCISCGTCTLCDTCLVFCPDVAIARADPNAYDIALDYCKGCGICAEECPRAAISMEEEGQ